MRPHVRPAQGSAADTLSLPQDMRLVWSNCHLYNNANSDVGRAGTNTSKYFEDLWVKSGLEQTGPLRNRRSNAGVAAAKYEPDLGPEHSKGTNAPPSGSKAKKVRVTSPAAYLLAGSGTVPSCIEHAAIVGWTATCRLLCGHY